MRVANNIHYNIFDFASLRGHLEDAASVSVRQYNWRKVEQADMDDYSQA